MAQSEQPQEPSPVPIRFELLTARHADQVALFDYGNDKISNWLRNDAIEQIATEKYATYIAIEKETGPENDRDPQWRPLINIEMDNIEVPDGDADYGTSYPDDNTQLFYMKAECMRPVNMGTGEPFEQTEVFEAEMVNSIYLPQMKMLWNWWQENMGGKVAKPAPSEINKLSE